MTPIVIQRGSGRHRALLFAVAAVAGVVLVIFATQLADFRLILLSRVFVSAVAILGLNIVAGYSGQLSLAHSAFLGMGAYTTTILTADLGWPFLATLPVVVMLGLIAGVVVGIPALRVRGLYLALLTFAVGLVFPVAVRGLPSLTGGANGKPVGFMWRRPDALGAFLTDAGWRFLVVAAMATVMFWLATRLVKGPLGRALVALRDNEIGATVSGVDVAWNRTIAFAISAVWAAVAGAMLTMVIPIVSPDAVGFHLTIELVTGMVVGGMRTISGALIGGLLVVWLPYYAAQWASAVPLFGAAGAGQLTNVLYGVTLIVITFAMPGGIAGGLRGLLRRVVILRDAPIANDLPSPPETPPPTTDAATAGVHTT